MKKSLPALFSTGLFLLFFVPQVAFAAWWNPFTWDFSSWFKKPPAQEQSIASSTSVVAKTAQTVSATIVKATVKTTTQNTSTQKTSPTNTPVVPAGTLCNGTYYSDCPAGQELICPTDGEKASCQPLPNVVPTDTPQQTPSAPTIPANSKLCNGSYYTSCSAGSAFICPSGGGAAYCQATNPVVQQTTQPTQQSTQNTQSQAQQALQAQQQAVLTSLESDISGVNTQLSTCISEMGTSISFQQGAAAVAQETKAAECQNIGYELNDFSVEQNFIVKGGHVTSTCSSQIKTLEQNIFSLRQQAASDEAGVNTSGIDLEAEQGEVLKITQTEAAQEAPLLQQVKLNLYYCQN